MLPSEEVVDFLRAGFAGMLINMAFSWYFTKLDQLIFSA